MKLLGAGAAAAALLLMLPAAARANVTIMPSCTVSGVTASCGSGWYTSDVTVSFSLSGSGFSNPTGCGNQTVSVDTSGTVFRCTVDLGGGSVVGAAVTIQRDATPPTTSGIAAQRGPDMNGWYNHPIQVAVSGTDAMSGIASCTNATYSGPDSGSASVGGTCTDNAGNVSSAATLAFQYDGTSPSASPTPTRAADAADWYNHPVDVVFSGTDAVSGVDTCTTATYSGPDIATTSVSGTCRDKAGNTASASFALRYDATPPSVTGATPDRAPDANGWYNHRFLVSFAGADATSGIASCDAPTYEKPNDAAAMLSGRCRDNAGNVSEPSAFAFKFDATPPKVNDLTLSSFDRTVTLTWKASADVTGIRIVRSRSKASSVTVYDGKRATTFTDKGVRNDKRYAYVLIARDAAGNTVELKALATPSLPLLAPRPAAHIRGDTMLRWRGVPHASYYNVQLWSGGSKVLTTWSSHPNLLVQHLRSGSYIWYVWPGFGPRSQHRYGALLGRSTFVVTG
jgi:hypothetical protein